MTQTEGYDVGRWFDEDMPLLHLYGQFSYHCEARIIGNVAGLKGLAEALLHAAETGRGSAKVSVVDGEGYRVEVERTNDTGLRYAHLPYNHDWGRAPSEHENDMRETLGEYAAEIETLRSKLSLHNEKLPTPKPRDRNREGYTGDWRNLPEAP